MKNLEKLGIILCVVQLILSVTQLILLCTSSYNEYFIRPISSIIKHLNSGIFIIISILLLFMIIVDITKNRHMTKKKELACNIISLISISLYFSIIITDTIIIIEEPWIELLVCAFAISLILMSFITLINIIIERRKTKKLQVIEFLLTIIFLTNLFVTMINIRPLIA